MIDQRKRTGAARCGACEGAAERGAGKQAETAAGVFSAGPAAAAARCWCWFRVPGNDEFCKLPELLLDRCAEAGGLSVGWRETLVFASGFPMPSAPDRSRSSPRYRLNPYPAARRVAAVAGIFRQCARGR